MVVVKGVRVKVLILFEGEEESRVIDGKLFVSRIFGFFVFRVFRGLGSVRFVVEEVEGVRGGAWVVVCDSGVDLGFGVGWFRDFYLVFVSVFILVLFCFRRVCRVSGRGCSSVLYFFFFRFSVWGGLCGLLFFNTVRGTRLLGSEGLI